MQETRSVPRGLIEEVWNRGRLEVVDELVDDAYVGHPSGTDGVGGYKQYFVALRTAFPDIRFSVEDEITEGSKVAVRWAATGTHQGECARVPPTGRRGEISGTTVFHIAEGKAVECWTNLDELGMLRQLGLLSDRSTRRWKEHRKNHNVAARSVWVDARTWGCVT